MDKLHEENIKIKKIKKPSESLMQAFRNPTESDYVTHFCGFRISSSKKKRIPHKSIVIEYSTLEKPIIVIWD